MSERTVAEILGWKLVPSHAPDVWPPMWHGPNGERELIGPRIGPGPKITPDDMLAFLRECEPSQAIEMWYDPESDHPDYYWVSIGTHCWHGRTLHNALEAAVAQADSKTAPTG